MSPGRQRPRGSSSKVRNALLARDVLHFNTLHGATMMDEEVVLIDIFANPRRLLSYRIRAIYPSTLAAMNIGGFEPRDSRHH